MPEAILEGMKVVDFTHIFSGPFASQMLGDLGADVVKIERIDGGDAARYYGLTDPSMKLSGPFVALNRNKRSVAVDLTRSAGREIVMTMIDSADVVIENFRHGVMQRWGMDYAALSIRNPRLVYCCISGFGRVGKLATKGANDLVMQAYGGLLSFTGEPGRPPVRCGTAISDFSAGLNAVLGVLGALLHRERTGLGQQVETSMLESQLAMMCYFFAEYWQQGIVPGPMGTANRLGMPNQAFPTSDGYVAITAANDRMFRRCCEELGVGHLADEERFSTLAHRYENREALVELLSAATSSKTTEECVAALERGGVSCSAIRTVAEAAEDPQLSALGAVATVPTQYGGTERAVGTPVHWSRTPPTVRRPVPRLGGGTREVLLESGYCEADIERFLEEGLISVGGEDLT